VIAEIIRWGACRNDQRVVTLWADKSGEVFDWLLDMAEAAGISTIMEPATAGADKPMTFGFLPDGQKSLMPVLVAKVQEAGSNNRSCGN
jgi:hypothetical protein